MNQTENQYQCCETPDIKDFEDGLICQNCSSIVDNLVFESAISWAAGDTVSQQMRKYKNYVLSIDIPWFVRETLLDSFNVIFHHFNDQTKRTNFININQLVIELMRLWGYEEYTKNLKGLKTTARVKAVRQFIYDAFNIKDINKVKVRRLEDVITLTELKSDYVPDKRIPIGVFNKVYS